MKLLPALLFCASASLLAEVTITTGDITDRRTTGKFFGGMDVELKLNGPELANCKGMRVTVSEVIDDTGKAVPPPKSGFSEKGFKPLTKPFGGFEKDKKPGEYEVKLELSNPARAAKSLKAVNGKLELLLAGTDPASVVTANLAKDAGKPLVNDALKAAGVEFTAAALKGNEAGYTAKDPNKKIASVEFCAADGTPLKTQGSSWSTFNTTTTYSTDLADKPPADVIAKIYLVTEKSLLVVPIALQNVPLP